LAGAVVDNAAANAGDKASGFFKCSLLASSLSDILPELSAMSRGS
jgi:hypothetical protein